MTLLLGGLLGVLALTLGFCALAFALFVALGAPFLLLDWRHGYTDASELRVVGLLWLGCVAYVALCVWAQAHHLAGL